MGSFMALDTVLAGLKAAFGWHQLLWLVIGSALGMVAGTLPGISGATMLSVLLVFVTKVPTDCMVIAMAAIYAASTYSGSTAGILYNVPGDAPGIPSTIEGYQMTLAGKSVKALQSALFGSFWGAVLSFFLMLFLVPLFISLVNFVGTGERALFALWALVIICGGALTKDDPLRGLLSMPIVLFIGTIGMQPNTGAIRFVKHQVELWDGFELLWVILGIFAIPQIVKLPYIKVNREKKNFKIRLKDFYAEGMRDCWRNRMLILKSTVMGSVVGVIPGIGAVTASWLGYSASEKYCKSAPHGKGAFEGIMGAETANNAAVPGTFVPLLSLGIPGSSANAIIMGAFIAVGIYPGPALIQNNGSLVWTIMVGIGLSAFVFLAMGVPFINMAQSMIKLPSQYLIVFIGVLTLLGTYVTKYSTFGIIMTILIGIVVMAGSKVGLIPSSMLLGFILGPSIENDLIRAYQIGGFRRFLKPISLTLLIIILITLVFGIVKNFRAAKKGRKSSGNALKDKVAEMEESLDEEHTQGSNSLNDLIMAIIGLSLCAFMYFKCANLNFWSRLWPYLIESVFLTLPSLVLLVRCFRNPQEIGRKLSSNASSMKKVLLSSRTFDFLVIIGGLTVSALAIEWLGFTGACMLYSLIVIGYFSRKILPTLIGTFGFGLGIYIMRVACNFPLPKGFLGL